MLNTMIIRTLALLVFLGSTAASGKDNSKCASNTESSSHSMVEILANPRRFDGKRVITSGVFGRSTQGLKLIGIYLTDNHYQNGDDLNVILLEPDMVSKHIENINQLEGKFVYIDGVIRVRIDITFDEICDVYQSALKTVPLHAD